MKHPNVCKVGLSLKTPTDHEIEIQSDSQSSIRLRYRNIDTDKKFKCLDRYVIVLT